VSQQKRANPDPPGIVYSAIALRVMHEGDRACIKSAAPMEETTPKKENNMNENQ
jgi:hypothetical protein